MDSQNATGDSRTVRMPLDTKGKPSDQIELAQLTRPLEVSTEKVIFQVGRLRIIKIENWLKIELGGRPLETEAELIEPEAAAALAAWLVKN